MILHRANKVPITKGICCNVNSNVIIDLSSLVGETHVAIQILSNLSKANVSNDWRYSFCGWPIELVYYNGASFQDHELQARYNAQVAILTKGRVVNKS